MADNLFKNSDPACIPAVPVIDFKFVEDCFIEPTPPPIFECVQPPVPNEPCIQCPVFDGGGKINVTYNSGGGAGKDCVTEPKIEVKITKTDNDPCQYNFDVNVDVPIPRTPCPEINVTNFEVTTRPQNCESGGSRFTVTPRPRKPENCDDPGECAFDLDLVIDVPVVQPPCPVINVNKFKVEAKSADCCTEDQCQSKFTITTNHTEPTCTEPGKCEFNVDLEITVPIPSVPCPEIKGKLKTTTGYVGAPCVTCINDITIQDKSKFEDLPAEDKPDGTYVGVENVSSLYTLAGDLKTWEPAGYEKPIFSLAELALLSPADRAGVTFVLQNPPTTYKKDDDGKWKPVVEPVADFTYSSVAERDAADSQTLPFSDRPLLRSTAAIPPGSVVKIDPPITYYRRKSVALWDKIRTRIEGVPSSVDRIVGSVAEMYNIPYSTSGSGSGLTVGAIVKVDLTPEPDGPITYYRRKSVAAWEKIRIKIEGVPSSVDRIVESTAEMYALPTGFGGVAVNGIVKVDETDVPASPVSYWRRQSVAVWEQIRTKIAGVPSSVDRIVESTAEMYALPTGSSGVNVGGIVKVDTTPVPPSPISYYRRKSVSLWEKINTKIEGVPSSVDQIVESVEEMQAIPYGNGGLWAGAIVKVDETDTAWQKQPDSTWQKIKNPMPTSVGGAAPTTTKINGAAVVSTPDIGPADAPVGSVTYVSSPPNQFVYEGGEWVPVIVPDDTITVYSEEDLDSIDTTERTAGMTVKVQKPTDRYLVVNGTLVPARCPESGFSVSSRKKKTEDCNEIPQCVFDLNLETLVQISKPPCPTINVTSFNVVTGFAGNEDDTQNVDETCLDCIVDETVETLEDAVTLALTAEPGTIIGINNPPTTYQLSNNLSTWEPTTTAAAITVADGAALTALLSDVNNGLQPGQKIHVTAPNSLYKISQDLKSWTPVNNNTAVPPTKLITVSTDADRDIIALSSRKKDMYVRVQNPTTDYTFTGSTIVPQTENENTVNTVADLDKIPENERAAGMFVTVLSPTDRVKVNDDHTISPANCPTNRFTITPRVIKGDDCNEPDKCEFDVDLQIAIPIPRVPCPIINVDNFQVNTHFTGGNNADDQACCIEGDTELVVTEVENNAARDALSFADVAIGGYAKTTDTGIFWRRTSDFKPDQWEAVADPTAAVCGSVFRVVPKHRTPENCQDPGQCEFDIELLINVPIPRTPCPEITTTTSVTVGYADSPCVACDTDMEVADLKELNAIPIADRTVGMRVKIKESITKYVRQNGEWVPGETDSTSTPADKTVANWGGVTLDDQVDGKIIDILDPPNQFLIGDGGEVNGKFRYSWEPLSDAGCEFDGPNNKTFTSTTTRDAYFANEYFGWHSACVTVINAPTRYTYKTEPIGGDNGLPIGWVGLSAGPATITVPSANDLPDEAADGTVVEVTNPTNRYKADDNKNWVADPCKTNSFIVRPRHDPPTDCNDPGKCAFDIILDLVIPIPRPPCPEFNVNTFNVSAVNQACIEQQTNCKPTITVNTRPELDDVPTGSRVAGMTGLVTSEDKLYTLGTNLTTWTVTRTNFSKDCCGNRFSITTRHEDNKVRKILNNKTELDDPTKVAGIKPGQVVAVKIAAGGGAGAAPTYQYYRAGDGVHAPKWTEITLNDPACESDPEKCIFDIDVNICVPIPTPPCPELNAKINTFTSYNDEKCTNCYADVIIGSPLDLITVIPPPAAACENPPDFYAKAATVPYRYTVSVPSLNYTVAASRAAGDRPPKDRPAANRLYAELEDFVAALSDQQQQSAFKNGDIVEIAFPVDRWRYNYETEAWENARCPGGTVVESRTIPAADCDDQPRCELSFFVDLVIPIPRPPCPEFTTSVRANAFYKNKKNIACSGGEPDLQLKTMKELKDLGPLGKGPDSIKKCTDLPVAGPAEGTVATVEANNTRWRWLTQYGGWWPATDNSAFIIIPKKTFDAATCEKTPKCEFDVILDVNVAVPQPPCPVFNTRTSSVTTCGTYPRSQIAITQRPQLCDKNEKCDDKTCIFDFDFKLDIPCPQIFGGRIDVIRVLPGNEGGTINVSRGCNATLPTNPCPGTYDYAVLDNFERDRKIYELVKPNQNQQSSGSDDKCVDPQKAAQTVGAVFYTQYPLPHGTYWTYLGGVENYAPQWEQIECDPPNAEPNCAFSFDASISVPFCDFKLEEDDDKGTHTGIPKKDRLKIYYVKPTEKCPNEDEDCPQPDRVVPDGKERDKLLGEPVGSLKGFKITAAGGFVEVTAPLVPGLKFTTDRRGMVSSYKEVVRIPGNFGPGPWITTNTVLCGGVGQNLCPEDLLFVQDGTIADKAGEKPDQQARTGLKVKVLADDAIWELKVIGAVVPFEGIKGAWARVLCKENDPTEVTLVVKPDKFEPCKLRYAMRVRLCQRQHDHIATCTRYFGDPCCDRLGCPCGESTSNSPADPSGCCGDEEDPRAPPSSYEEKDGSEDIGNSWYNDAAPPPSFRAKPDFYDTWAPVESTPDDDSGVVAKQLPRLEAKQEDPPDEGNKPEENESTKSFDPDKNNPCVAQALDDSEDCDEDPPTDPGYRPFKALELRVKEIYPKDRLTPPKIKHYIEAAMNCLHGGTVTVKKGTKPTAPPNPDDTPDPDAIGEGTIEVLHNRINLDITLWTEECPTTPTTPSPPPFTARPTPETISVENPVLASTASVNPAALTTEDSQITPGLLKSLIKAINTDPALKAAIRQVVNQPDE